MRMNGGMRTMNEPVRRSRSHGPARRAAGVLLALATALAAASCSGDDGDDGGNEESSQAGEGPDATAAPKGAKLKVRPGKVTGQLKKSRTRRVARDVGDVVDRWFRSAYLGGEYPRNDFSNAFGTFTRDLRRRARQDKRQLSNARFGKRIDDVVAVRRVVRVDLLSPKGKPAGATARINLAFDTSGKAERRVVVRGRVMLTKGGKGNWRIFAYDVSRSHRAIPAKSRKGDS